MHRNVAGAVPRSAAMSSVPCSADWSSFSTRAKGFKQCSRCKYSPKKQAEKTVPVNDVDPEGYKLAVCAACWAPYVRSHGCQECRCINCSIAVRAFCATASEGLHTTFPDEVTEAQARAQAMLCDEPAPATSVARAHAAPASVWAPVAEPPGLRPELSTTETNPFGDMTEGNKGDEGKGQGKGKKPGIGKGKGKESYHCYYPEIMTGLSQPQFTELMQHIDARMDWLGQTVHYHGELHLRAEQKLQAIHELIEITREEQAVSASHLMKKLKSISKNMNDHSSSSSSAHASRPQTLRGDDELASGFEVLPEE